MQGLLISLSLSVIVGVLLLAPTNGGPALVLCASIAFGVAFLVRRMGEVDRTFLVELFVGALLIRVALAALIFSFGWQEFFGGDAYTYDMLGSAMLHVWHGDMRYKDVLADALETFWGMPYYIAAIYALVGRNMLAVQFVNSIMGAATAPAAYLCARQIFNNQQVARLTGFLAAFFPSLVLWSAQGLKDGPIVFLLTVAMLATLKLGERLSVKYFIVLVAALLGLLGMRFYIFYMMLIAVGGAFVIGMRQLTTQSLARQLAIIVGMGLALTYWGVLRTASVQYESYGTLETVQRSRADLASGGAPSGVGEDVA